MSATFRYVLFIPNPFSPEHVVPVAAVLRREGLTEVILRKVAPCASCLGGDNRLALLEVAIKDLEGHRSMSRLPMAMGPHFKFSTRTYTVPEKVADPKAWVEDLL